MTVTNNRNQNNRLDLMAYIPSIQQFIHLIDTGKDFISLCTLQQQTVLNARKLLLSGVKSKWQSMTLSFAIKSAETNYFS